jgi:hypothetical protein
VAGPCGGPSRDVLVTQHSYRSGYAALRQSLLLNGFDAHLVHGWVSAVQPDSIIDEAIGAFDDALARLGRAGETPNIFPS